MRVIDDFVPLVADIIAAHCPGTQARDEFMQACLRADWAHAKVMIEGMLAEPWHLIGFQEIRLRDFLELLGRVQGDRSSGPA